MNSLQKFHNSSKNVLHNTDELKNDLKQKGLIVEDFSEYFNFEILNNKDVKEKQQDLDHFLNG